MPKIGEMSLPFQVVILYELAQQVPVFMVKVPVRTQSTVLLEVYKLTAEKLYYVLGRQSIVQSRAIGITFGSNNRLQSLNKCNMQHDMKTFKKLKTFKAVDPS